MTASAKAGGSQSRVVTEPRRDSSREAGEFRQRRGQTMQDYRPLSSSALTSPSVSILHSPAASEGSRISGPKVMR